MRSLLFATLLILSFNSFSQTTLEKKAINNLCGCFEVEFKYAETFSPDPDYKFHNRDEISGGVELSLPIEVTDRKVVIQHLLVINDSIIVKHWREEWTYENPAIWVYQGDKTWKKETIAPEKVKGKWTQTIWEVSDEPRYQGYSPFVELDGKVIWQNTVDAPLPRREYTVRSDYNILKRTNRLNITDSGYIHEQDNEKILRTDASNKLITQEKGINSYKRIADKECSPALKYWDKNKDYWGKVRSEWSKYLSSHDIIKLNTKVQNKVLHEYLIDLSKAYLKKEVSEQQINQKIAEAIASFIRG